MYQCDDDERTLPMYVYHDAPKHGCVHLDLVNKIWIHLKKSCLAIHAPRFVIDPTIEDAPVCDALLRVLAAIVSELRVPAAANVVEQFVQTPVV
ncbi:hypothetical protein TNCV_964401 [Trichonephila clavipes]|nr:hypothetical protein TNCV_964401 [Trichonephila clavipes]